MTERESLSLDVRYELGHSYRETWTQTELFCPACGEHQVWIESGAGDYYQGPNHLCAACASAFTMPMLSPGADWQNKQRLEAIRAEASS